LAKIEFLESSRQAAMPQACAPVAFSFDRDDKLNENIVRWRIFNEKKMQKHQKHNECAY
jgi:hypothetical protein